MTNARDRDGSGDALRSVRVLDLTRLAPGPYCTMLLADMGADVISIGGGSGSPPIAALSRGKRRMRLDLKTEAARAAFHRLTRTADVVVEGSRPGVAARLGIDYDTLRAINPRLIYCSITGYGQSGPLAQDAGHDINYLAASGVLGALGPAGEPSSLPLNLIADFAGGSLFALAGILGALYQRERTGTGQYIDTAMVDGCLSLMAMHMPDWGRPVLPARGEGLLSGAAPFYRCYVCADGRQIAVGALERKFFERLWEGLGLAAPAPRHLDRTLWPDMTREFARLFANRSRDDWASHFAGRDACVSAVLDPDEALVHPQNLGGWMAHACAASASHPHDDRTADILREAGLSPDEISAATLPVDAAPDPSWPPL